MSRSGYRDDGDAQWALIRWRGAVASAIRGKKGQAFLREMLAAMDALPEKVLIAEDLEKDGCFCALGTVGNARGTDMAKIDPEDRERVAYVFGIPFTLACEVMYENDEHTIWNAVARRYVEETPEQRFARMRAWVVKQLAEPVPA